MKTNALNTPILIVAFNRPDKTKKVLENVRKVRPKQVFLSVDGPRSNRPEEKEKVEAVRELVSLIDWECEVKTLFRTENLGCRNGVSSGIDWFFEQVEQGIILEDDCVPDISFFYYCENLLDRYKNEERIFQIAGSNLAEAYFSKLETSYFYSNFALIWGWATWRRAWQKMDLDMVQLEAFKQKKYIERLVPDKGAQAYMIDKFEDTQKKINDSWAYAWFYSLLLNDGLAVIPSKNLVQNIGMDEAATHTTSKYLKRYKKPASTLSFPLKHPENVQKQDEKAAMAIFYVTQKPRILLLINKLLPLSWLKASRKLRKKYGL